MKFADHFEQYIDDPRVRWDHMLVERSDLEQVENLEVEGEYDREIDLAMWNNELSEIHVLEIKSDGEESKAREQNAEAKDYFEEFYDTVTTSIHSECIVPESKLFLQKLYNSGGLFTVRNTDLESKPIFQEVRQKGFVQKISEEDVPRFLVEEENMPDHWNLDTLTEKGIYSQWTETSYNLDDRYLRLARIGELYSVTEEGERHLNSKGTHRKESIRDSYS